MVLDPKIKYRINYDLNKSFQSDFRKKLNRFLKNVYVIEINEKVEKYRIGSNEENSIYGKDYIVLILRVETLTAYMQPGATYRLLLGIDNSETKTTINKMMFRLGNEIMREFTLFFSLKNFLKKKYPQFVS